MKELKYLCFLLPIAKVLTTDKKITTTEVAQILGISQQSASRKLRELSKAGLIDAKVSVKGYKIEITKKGRDLMELAYTQLEEILNKSTIDTISGIVVSGLGEGAYYVSQPHYKKHLSQLLGNEPFPGTLNVKASDEFTLKRFLSQLQPKKISGFTNAERTFGSLLFYDVFLNDLSVGLVVPERTIHSADIFEIVSHKNLRKFFNLKDGDEVRISWKKKS